MNPPNKKLFDIISKLESGVSVNSIDEPIKETTQYGILKTSCISSGKFYHGQNKTIIAEDLKRAKLNPVKDSILISRMNTPQLVGESGYIDKDHPNLFIPDRLWMTSVDKNYTNSKLLSIILSSENMMGRISNIATGTSGSMKNISKPNFLNLEVQVPTLPEQQKIATFLTAVDEKLQALKQKKSLLEQYKKGVMQKIFSQELRFTDDNGSAFADWEEKMLGEVGETYNGLTGKTKENFGNGKPYIQYKQIFDDSKIDISRFELVEISSTEKQNKVLFGDVFFTVSSETPNEIGMSSVLLDEIEELYLNSFCFGYRAYSLEILSPYFSKYLFRSELFRNEIVKLAQGSTRFNMSKIQLMKIAVRVPSLAEQTKIANFLSAIDDKVNQCQELISKTEVYKKGLLQQMFV